VRRSGPALPSLALCRTPGSHLRNTLIAGEIRGRVRHSSYPASLLFRTYSERVPDDQPRVCDFCGRHESDPARTLTWSTAVENGRQRTYCDVCSREHLRSMEGKLDSEYW
jgi:hypothetical protein